MSVSVRPQDLSLIRILVENVRPRFEAAASGGVDYVRRYIKRRYMRAFRPQGDFVNSLAAHVHHPLCNAIAQLRHLSVLGSWHPFVQHSRKVCVG